MFLHLFDPRTLVAHPALVCFFLASSLAQAVEKGEYPIPRPASKRARKSSRRKKPARLRG